jgi:hypothetical protein
MLNVVREFALEQLAAAGELVETRAAHGRLDDSGGQSSGAYH